MLWYRSRRLSFLVCHHAAAFLLLVQCCVGQYEMVSTSRSILAMLGDDVVLPCRLLPAADLTGSTLEWARSDLSPRFVHLRRDGVELLVNQHPSFMGRTAMSVIRMEHGDISLQLSNVKLSDEGIYGCNVPEKASAEVQLIVGAAPQQVAIAKAEASSSDAVLLRCESAGWYPEPELLWLDGEGTALPAAPAETLRGPDGLYRISSRASVQRTHRNTFTCRVQQNHINQSREAQVHFQGAVTMDLAISAARVAIVSIVAAAFMTTLIVCRWKVRRRDEKEKAERLRHSSILKDKLFKEKEEEQRGVDAVIQLLQEQKEGLQTTKEQQESQLEEAEQRRRKTDKKLAKIKNDFMVHKTAKIRDRQFEQHELKDLLVSSKASLQETEDKLHKTDKMIEIMMKLKIKEEQQADQVCALSP